MQYQNPVLPGFYPDPSAIRVGDAYYLVCSSFNYFPGVPLFESHDLVNWTQIGHVLTRSSQLPLAGASTSGGIYAPTLRYNHGRFYMVTTNVDHGGNFYVYTDDIHGEWSDPIWVEQGGIDPSLYFEDEQAYFMSNGDDDDGHHGITQCLIDINTGKKLSPSRCIWTGAGGRYLEGPHLYRINKTYYLIASEGGTEYGHMLVYARGKSPNGPFENYANNPVLTNRDLGGYQIQGCGHADLIEDVSGHFWLLHLAFRQLDRYMQHHTLGRETYLTPVKFDTAGWFTAGDVGTTRQAMRVPDLPEVKQIPIVPAKLRGIDWVSLREPDSNTTRVSTDYVQMRANSYSLEETETSPAAMFIRQRSFQTQLTVKVSVTANRAGITAYMTENQHYDAIVEVSGNQMVIGRRLRVGPVETVDHAATLPLQPVQFRLTTTNMDYRFEAIVDGVTYDLGSAPAKYLSSEIAGNFTGVMLGLFCEPCEDVVPSWTTFDDFDLSLESEVR